ncbi:condensation domain-containing protein [Vibrio sp. Of14-4]|uniref:condensation domain-containing protein n=1 Tax=Vibrio sp. Of14-4 TaxID=2724878 RepID=UPI001EF3C8FA|nr:condensation domain-containing protein [Vibrio sp. Of14-4]MCG7488025.1 condensation domain-containing protein [Vibrio sp. Of14-4]
MYNVKNEQKALLSISEHEEQVWMKQLQDPESQEWKVFPYTIDFFDDSGVMEEAVKKLVLTDFKLNLRFGFSEDFELEKWHSKETEQFLDVRQIADDDVSDSVFNLATTAWEPENQSPFKVYILQTTQAHYLCIAIHPILNDNLCVDDIVSCLEANYQAISSSSVPQKLNPKPVNLIQGKDETVCNSNIEQIILDEFKASLNDPNVELDDDFFEVGGHSLLATRIIGNLITNHGIEISFNDFFKSPSAQALALCANQVKVTAEKINSSTTPLVSDLQRPLSLAQSFLWDAHIATGQCAIFNLPFAIRFDADVDELAFKHAFNDLMIRHTGLRTLFVGRGSRIEQHVIDERDLAEYSWFWGSGESAGASLESEAGYVFDLSKELGLRIRFFRDKQTNQQTLSFLIHHMIIDEWSLNNLMPELSHAYLARLQGQSPTWDKPAYSIDEYALTQGSRGPNQDDIRYWVNHLQDATPGLNLRNSLPEQLNETVNPIAANWVEIDLGIDAHRVVSGLAREYNSSTFSVVYSAIAKALHSVGDLKDLVIGTSASGRDDAKYFDSVGYFTTMVAHRIQFKPEQGFEELVEDVTRTINDSMQHATVPIDIVQRELGLDPKNGLLFDVYAQIHADNALYGSLQKPNGESVSYQQILPNKTESLFGLHFEIMENLVGSERSLRLIVTYQTARYSKEQILEIGSKMKSILTSKMVENPQVA